MNDTMFELTPEETELLNLGDILGQQRTLGVVAGKCSAGQAATLHRLREQKLYKRITPHWEEFCSNCLKISATEANRTIRYWQEFGPAFFELAQLTRISAETYRAIAPSLKDGALHHNGEVIPMTGENARKLASAVADMRRALPAPAAKGPRAATPAERVGELDRRCSNVAEEFRDLVRQSRDGTCREQLGALLERWKTELRRIESDYRAL